MKKTLAVLIGLLLLTGCFNTGMNLEYLTPSETPIDADSIYLRVKDAREDRMIVSPDVMQKGMFEDVGDRVNLVSKSMDGKTVTVKNVTIEEAVREMLKTRVEALGMKTLNEFSEEKPSLTVEIEKLSLETADTRTLKATVTALISYFKGSKQIHSIRITKNKREFYVSGEKTGQAIISSVLTDLVNDVEMKRFMN